MKRFWEFGLLYWALATVLSLFLLGGYYLPTPWDWVAAVFLVCTVFSVVAWAVEEVDE